MQQHEDDHQNEEQQFQAELQRAMEASRPVDQPTPAQSSTQSSFLSERAQLEKARLERQKRLRGEVGDDAGEDAPPLKRQQPSSSSRVRLDKVSLGSATLNPHSAPAASPDEVFWDGEIRQTGNMYADPKKNNKPNFHLTYIIGDVSNLLCDCKLYELNM